MKNKKKNAAPHSNELYHYGVKGMQWGKHVKATTPYDNLRNTMIYTSGGSDKYYVGGRNEGTGRIEMTDVTEEVAELEEDAANKEAYADMSMDALERTKKASSGENFVSNVKKNGVGTFAKDTGKTAKTWASALKKSIDADNTNTKVGGMLARYDAAVARTTYANTARKYLKKYFS